MQRNEDESFEDYKVRRTLSDLELKMFKKGVLFWDSDAHGTYFNKVLNEYKAAKKKAGSHRQMKKVFKLKKKGSK